MRLMAFLSKHVGVTSDGSMDEPTLTLTRAFLYVIDVSSLQIFDENDVVQKLNILTEQDLSLAIHKQLMNSPEEWQMRGIKVNLSTSLGCNIKDSFSIPVTSVEINFGDCLEEDEKTVDAAIVKGVFQYLKTLIVKNSIFHQQEYFLKRIDILVTDFLVLMPLKVKDLKNRGDETARVIASRAQKGLKPPENLQFHFEHLLNLMELEEIETRMEEYPVTRAMLTLLDTLLNHPYPPALGSSTRQPGIEPYIQFVRDSVLLRSNSRAYKVESEKWKIMGLCFKILEKVLRNCNFSTLGNINSSNPSYIGISVLSQILQDSELLRVVLFILDEGVRILDQYSSVSGQSILEETTLLALKLIYVTLSKQEAFLEQIRESGCDLLVTSLGNLLLNINPRSGQADHLLVIAKLERWV